MPEIGIEIPVAGFYEGFFWKEFTPSAAEACSV